MGRNALVISDRLYRPARTLNVGYVTQANFFVKEEKQRAGAKPEADARTGDGETNEAAGQSLQEIASRCDGLARVIIPIIRSLYRGPQA